MQVYHFALILASSFVGAHETDVLSWSILPTRLPAPISDMTATLNDGLVYIAGGCNADNGNAFSESTGYYECDSFTNAFYSFNPETNEFVSLPTLPRPRMRHGAAVSNNRLWLIGGRTVQEDLILEVDVFEFASNTWITPGSLANGSGTSDNAVFGYGDFVYSAGGWNGLYAARNDLFRFDATNVEELIVSEMAPLREARGDVKAVVDANGLATVVGGFTDQNNYCPPLATVEQYDVSNDSWMNLNDLNSPRGDKALLMWEGTHVVALGGEKALDATCTLDNAESGTATVVIDDVEFINDFNSWETTVSLPDARFRFDGVTYKGNMYVFGGQQAYKSACQCYDGSDVIFVSGVDSENSAGVSLFQNSAAVWTMSLAAITGMLGFMLDY